jgi:uncharacterized membrane protein YcjF (UPF0283 family)
MNPTAETGASMVAKATPPIAVIGAQFAGIPVDDWVKWVTLAYVVLMLLHKVWQVGYEAYRFWILKERKPKRRDE